MEYVRKYIEHIWHRTTIFTNLYFQHEQHKHHKYCFHFLFQCISLLWIDLIEHIYIPIVDFHVLPGRGSSISAINTFYNTRHKSNKLFDLSGSSYLEMPQKRF